MLITAMTRDNEVFICGDSSIQKYVIDLHASTFKCEWKAEVNSHVVDLVCFLDNALVIHDNAISKSR